MPTAIYRTRMPREINEFKKDLILWAQNQASGYRTEAALANRQFVINEERAKAESYENMVKYLEGMGIRE